MKTLVRYYLINFSSLWIATQLISGLTFTGGFRTLLLGGLAFAVINIVLVPVLKILLLPLNLLTLGLFAWVSNVLALFALTRVLPQFMLLPYDFPGYSINGFIIPPFGLTPLWVAIIASLIIGIITHFLHWLMH
ncbi:phage holin family protein [Candidatus Daviesbacteria bacterium]|nr:phage holin family protein [Candidatus Daviesbacteria bacterium]